MQESLPHDEESEEVASLTFIHGWWAGLALGSALVISLETAALALVAFLRRRRRRRHRAHAHCPRCDGCVDGAGRAVYAVEYLCACPDCGDTMPWQRGGPDFDPVYTLETLEKMREIASEIASAAQTAQKEEI
jgi:hypothetical protein